MQQNNYTWHWGSVEMLIWYVCTKFSYTWSAETYNDESNKTAPRELPVSDFFIVLFIVLPLLLFITTPLSFCCCDEEMSQFAGQI